MEIPEQIWLLIARNLSGEASETEQKELSEILLRDEQLHQHYDLLTRIWVVKQNSLQNEDDSSAKDTVSHIISMAENEDEPKPLLIISEPRIKKRRTWMAAASILIVAIGGWSWFGNKSSGAQEKKHEIIEAHNGSRTRSVLADGSTVWLNAGSKLYYENDFTGTTREIRLDGEAFFDIVKKTDHPFIVHTSGIDIKVLGTSFNVKSYPEDKTVETTLYRGSVKVFRHEESEKKAIQLKPNEKLILSKEAAIAEENLSYQTKTSSPAKAISAISTIAHIDSTKKENERIETAWVYNRLEFRGDNFEVLARKLERWYNVTIVFTDETVKELSFVGTFETETVEQAFRSLKVANTFNYKINNHEIFVGSAK
jgi:transmembrane sensor